MRTVALAVCMLLVAGTVQGAFVVKYFIDGHICAPVFGLEVASSWIVEMDGDLSSPEMIVVGAEPFYGTIERVGVTRLVTGETQWFSVSEVGRAPTVASAFIQDSGVHGVLRANPAFYDVDGDGLVDALVPVMFGSQGSFELRTAVIGWDPTAAALSGAPASIRAGLASRPNPATDETTIDFHLASDGQVSVRLFDVSGRQVRELLVGPLPAGDYFLRWDGRDDAGREVPAGTYFTRIETSDGVTSGKVVVAR